MILKFLYIVAAGLLFLFVPLHANVRYLAQNGSDAASGQVDSPWSTITHAVSKLQAGDTLLIRGGTYDEGEIWIREQYGMGGRNGQYLTIMAYKQEKPVFVNSQRGMIVNASYVRVQGLYFANGKEMYTVNWDIRSSHVVFIGNTFTGRPGYAAISITGDDHLVQDNTVQLDGNTLGTQGHGIYLMEGARNVIRKNRISGMSGYGIHVYDERKSEDPAGFQHIIQDALVEGNIVYNSQARSGIIVGVGADGGPAYARNVIVRNNVVYNCQNAGIIIHGWSKIQNVQVDQNTIYNNPEAAIDIEGQVDGIQIRNNILYQKSNRPHVLAGSGIANMLVDNNLYFPAPRSLAGTSDRHAIEADPLFVDAKAGTFTLAANSPAIDAGINIGRPYTGKAPDLGAFEFNELEPGEQGGEGEEPKTSEHSLFHSFPNPFSQDTLIHYDLANNDDVLVDIFDLAGQHLVTLLNEQQVEGSHELLWNGRDKNGQSLPSGIYFCRLRTPSTDQINKMIRIR
jgi:parallel beta-helix repeat protein